MNFQRCDDGSDGRRGFVSTPANDTDWPVCKYGKYIQPEFIFPTKPHKIEPFSSSYSLSCAASSPSWRSTTGHKNYIFQDLTFFVWRFHTLWCRRSPRRAVRWTTRRTRWSVSRSRLAGIIGWWNEAPAWFHFLSVEPWHISAEHLCDGCELREEEVEQRTLQRAEGLGSSLHRLPLRCHGWGEVFQPYLFRLRLRTLDDNIAQNGVKMYSLGERPLQGKFLLCLLNGGDKVIGFQQVPVARQFRLQKGPEKLAHHRIHLWWGLLSNLSQNLFTPSRV